MITLRRASSAHGVSTLELFFDLVFVFAITQVTAFVAKDPTAGGALRGALILCLVYWAWVAYSWLGSSTSVDDRGATLALLAAMAAMFVVAVLLPQWFAGTAWAVAAAVCYLAVRALHIALFHILGADTPGLRKATARLGVSVAIAAALLITGAVLGGTAQVVLVLLAVIIEPIGAFVGGGSGWFLAADHFAERHGLIVIIAIGESLIALGLAASDVPPTIALLGLVVLGAVVASLVYLLYFRRVGPALAAALEESDGLAQVRLGRDVFSYGHLLIIGGIVALALWLKKTAAAVAEEGLAGHLHGIAGPSLAVAGLLLVGGLGLLLLRAGQRPAIGLWAGAVVIIAAGLSAELLPIWAVVLLAIAGLGLATLIGRSASVEGGSPAAGADPAAR